MSLPSEISVRITLMGGLKDKAPPEDRLQLAEGSSIHDALRELGIQPAETQIVMRNGKPQMNRDLPLADGDQLTVLPLIGGG